MTAYTEVGRAPGASLLFFFIKKVADQHSPSYTHAQPNDPPFPCHTHTAFNTISFPYTLYERSMKYVFSVYPVLRILSLLLVIIAQW